jgi:xylulokinase
MYLGIDLGTGSVKLMLVDPEGRERVASRSYPIESPEPGFAETDPETWLDAIRDAARELPALGALRAIGLSGQMHGVVATRLDGLDPVARAILWADRRGMKYLDRFEGVPPDMARRMSNAPAAGLTATTLLWLKHEKPGFLQSFDRALFPKDYIRAQLTGNVATDYSDASGSLMYDFRERTWYGELIDRLGLPRGILPEIRPSSETGGAVTAAAARRLGLPEGVPVAIGAADVTAAMFGSDLVDPSEVQVSVGTAAQVSRPIPADRLPGWNPSLNVYEGVLPTQRYRVAAMLNAGIALEWVRGLFRREWSEVYLDLEKRGLQRPLDLTFLPYLTGERTPYMNPDARGAWLGLSLNHSEGDLLLAALVGVACSIRLGMETLGLEGLTRVHTAGGSFRHSFWRRLVATALGRSISVSWQRDISARGAARIAALSIGEELPIVRGETQEVEPEPSTWMEDYYLSFQESYRRVYDVSWNRGQRSARVN